MTKIYRVDDGEWHWVFAESTSDALAVWQEHMNASGVPDKDLDLNDPPLVQEIPMERAADIKVYEDYEVVGTLLQEFEKDPKRSYVGGPEW